MYWFVLTVVMLCSLVGGCQCAAFNDLFYPSWALYHVMSRGELLQLKLDHTSGLLFSPNFSASSSAYAAAHEMKSH